MSYYSQRCVLRRDPMSRRTAPDLPIVLFGTGVRNKPASVGQGSHLPRLLTIIHHSASGGGGGQSVLRGKDGWCPVGRPATAKFSCQPNGMEWQSVGPTRND